MTVSELSPIHRLAAAAFVAAALSGAALPARAAETSKGGQDKAQAVASAVMKAGGGADAINGVKYMRFTFAVEKEGKILVSRTHYWDRVADRHRLEWTDKDGKKIVCLTHLPSKEGVCVVDGQAKLDEEAAPYVKKAYATWINDTYWLLMPYKMGDPGVHLKYDGEAKENGKTYDKVMLTFDDGIGLTSKDRYWAFVDRKTGRMDSWAFVLQDDKGQPGAGEPDKWTWKGWSSYGGVMLANERDSADGKTKILFKDLAVFNDLPDGVFSKTEAVPPLKRP